jgi:hypothetical protein
VTLTVLGGDLLLPRWQGETPYGAPDLAPPDDPEADHSHDGVLWQIERDVLKRLVRARVDYGSTYETPYSGKTSDRNVGTVQVDQRTYRQACEVEAWHEIVWPEATVATTSTLSLVADDTHYDISIKLVATEGDDVVATRDWHERLPRDLA